MVLRNTTFFKGTLCKTITQRLSTVCISTVVSCIIFVCLQPIHVILLLQKLFALVIKLFVLQTLRLCIWLFMLPKSSAGGIQQGKAHSVNLTKLHCWAFFTAASCGAGRQQGSNCCFSGCQPAPSITANVKQKPRTLMLKNLRRNFSEKNVYQRTRVYRRKVTDITLQQNDKIQADSIQSYVKVQVLHFIMTDPF